MKKTRRRFFTFVTSASFIFAAVGVSVAIAALTFNSTSITSDGVLYLNPLGGNVGIGTTTPATLFTVATATNIFNVLANGNVGIGTTTPSSKLVLDGNYFRISNSESNGETLRLGAAYGIPGIISVDGTTEAQKSIVIASDNGGGGNIQFVTGASEVMRITTSSRLVIGTNWGIPSTFPTFAQLTVQNRGVNPSSSFNVADGNGKSLFFVSGDSVGIGTTTPATFFTVASGSSNFFNITSSGNVGIGTTTPSSALTVVGSTSLGAGGTPISKHLSAAVSITGTSISSSSCSEYNVALTGANVGDSTYATPSTTSPTANLSWSAYISGAGTSTIRVCNPTVNNITLGNFTWRVDDWQH